MPDKDDGTPRVFLYRHGETEWTINGRYTSTTDLPLTSHGRDQVTSTGTILIGPGKLIDPSNVAAVYISPRLRAYETYELAISGSERKTLEKNESDVKVVKKEERLAEWEYGLYEGLVTKEIRQGRKERGLDTEREWDIWRDGCEEGESPTALTTRLDSLISEIQSLHAPLMHHHPTSTTAKTPTDIILFAHGHLLRAFVKRWLNLPLDFALGMMIEPGGVGVLR